ncbi:hypothetical protein [Pseudarthrobacter sp. NPDC080039]|uniref:hypothetical protein n=1 Tax=unclassified Pseudarthrobacter TaxID=2647000 RepID=UPI00344EF92F
MKSRTRAFNARMAWLGAAGVSAALLAGCAAGPDSGAMPAATDPGALRSVSGTAPATADGGSSASPSSADVTAATAADSPSPAAKMICGDETRSSIARILALPSPPPTTDAWADSLYTCTYALPPGSFVLSVKETPDPAGARAHFEALQQKTASARPIEGMANLGFQAFQTPAAVVFVKDNFVLTVDATRLPATLGPHDVTSGAFAYQVATTVLACWSE